MATTPPREIEFHSVLGADALFFRRMYVREELGRLTEMKLELLRPFKLDPVVAKDLMGTKATVTLMIDESAKRHFNGHVVRCVQGASRGRYAVYHLELRPWLWFLTRSADCRIFHEKTAVEILDTVFLDYSGVQIEKKLTATYHKRTFCAQYRETDFDFVSRLMEEEGIYYFVKHADGQHTLVLCDAVSAHAAIPGGTLKHVTADSASNLSDDHVWEWQRVDSLQSLKYTHTDFAFQFPSADLTTTASVAETGVKSKPADLDLFDYPGHYDDPTNGSAAARKTVGEKYAKSRVGELESRQVVASGLSNFRHLSVGCTFSLADHPQAGDYLITAATYELEFGEQEARRDVETGPGFRCRFEAIPKATRFQPQRITPRPFVHGPQTAVVVGASGDEILTDEFGRVRLQFRWDRLGTKDEKSSAWVRVSHPWASKGFGMIALPRVGDEVVVSFLEGDPDQPMVTGRVYNAENMPIYKLPDHATIAGIRTRSSKEGTASNFNELRFEDKKGSEYVRMQAEKDYHRHVKASAFDFIGGNETQVVKGLRKESVEKDWTVKAGENYTAEVVADVHATVGSDTVLTIGGVFETAVGADMNLSVSASTVINTGSALVVTVGAATSMAVGADMNLDVSAELNVTSGGDMSISSGGVMAVESGGDLNLKGGGKVIIEAASGIVIKSGSSFISIGPGGIDIVGSPMVKINSGGGGGSAKAAKKATKEDKVEAVQATKPEAVAEWQDPLPSS